MRPVILFFLLIASISSSFAQTAYFKTDNSGLFNKVIRLSSGFITYGYDANYKHEFIRWDDNFTAVWKVKVTEATATGGVFNNIVQANDGSFYAMLLTTQNSGAVAIIKISSTGAILWQKMYYLPGNQLLLSTCLAKGAGTDNGFIFGSGQCALSNCLVKCDENGNIVWQKQYVYTLATGVITSGSILPEANGYTVSSGYNINSLLNFKIDASGSILSDKVYTYSGMQIIPMKIVKLNASNGYAIMGNYNSTNNNKTEFVAFYDNALTLTAFKELTVTYDQFKLEDITAVNNGANVVVVGSIYHSSVFYEAIINMQVTGGIVWKHRGGGNTMTTNKNVEFRGVTEWGTRIVSVGGGMNEGQVVSVMDFAGAGLCTPIAFDVTSATKTLALQNGILVEAAGNVTSTAINFPTVTTMANTKTFYCGSLPVTAVSEVRNEEVAIYPSPADDHLTVICGSDKAVELKIYAADGKIVYGKSVNATTNINTANWSEGLYIISVSDGLQAYYKKVMVMH
jgi:hypothetical protein